MTLAGGIGAPEAVKHQLFLPFLKAHALVGDGHTHGPVVCREVNRDGVALRVIDGVREQVAQDALDAP